MKLESYILNDFFNILNEKSINYCVMNNYTFMPEVIPSDVDFAIEEKAFNKLDSLVFDLASKHNVVITQKIWHGYNKCAYILTPLNIEEYFWLQLDFFVDFCAKGYPNLISINQMLQNKKQYKNFYTPVPEIEVPFIIQRRIIKGDLKVKHLNILHDLYLNENDVINEELSNMFGSTLGQVLTKVIIDKDLNLFNNNLATLKIKLKEVSNNNFWFDYKLKYYIQQIKRTIYRIVFPTGISIAFIGNNSLDQDDIIEKVDNVISGSFHGTLKSKPPNLFVYLCFDYFKIIWAKITKRKVYINIRKGSWNSGSLYFFKKVNYIKPDFLFLNEDANNLENIENNKLNGLTYLILKKQSDRTHKHLFNFLSPTR